MIRSMTGFARKEFQGEPGTLVWELRAVNHRFLDLGLRLPEEFSAIEGAVREHIQASLARGRVEASLRYQPPAGTALRLNQELAAALENLAEDLAEQWDVEEYSLPILDFLRWPGMVQTSALAPDTLRETVLQLLDGAIADLLAVREREGMRLRQFLLERLDRLDALVAQLRARLPDLEAALRARLQARMGDLTEAVEPGRLEQELVFFLHRMDVAEELDRLQTHADELRRILDRKEAVGRRLDFMMQELNREANTLGSKSTDAGLSQTAVELKVIIEQMREQVQNIE